MSCGGEPDAVHDVEPLVHQPGACQHVEQRGRGRLLPGRGRLDARFVDVGEHRQSCSRDSAAMPSSSSCEQRCGADGASAQVCSGVGLQAEPLDLRGDEVEFVLGVAVGAGDALADRLRQVLGHERRDVERGAVARGNREHDADAGLFVSRQHGVDHGLVLRHAG